MKIVEDIASKVEVRKSIVREKQEKVEQVVQQRVKKNAEKNLRKKKLLEKELKKLRKQRDGKFKDVFPVKSAEAVTVEKLIQKSPALTTENNTQKKPKKSVRFAM